MKKYQRLSQNSRKPFPRHLLHKPMLKRAMAGIVLKYHQIYHNIVKIAIGWYITGLLIFHTKADFTNHIWTKIYYSWQKTGDCLYLLALYYLVPSYRRPLTPIIFYSIIRLCFQIIGFFRKTGQNDQFIITSLYLIALTIVVYLTIK